MGPYSGILKNYLPLLRMYSSEFRFGVNSATDLIYNLTTTPLASESAYLVLKWQTTSTTVSLFCSVCTWPALIKPRFAAWLLCCYDDIDNDNFSARDGQSHREQSWGSISLICSLVQSPGLLQKTFPVDCWGRHALVASQPFLYAAMSGKS